MFKRSRKQTVKMIANAKVSAHEKWNYGEYWQPKTTLEHTLKKETAPTQLNPSSLSYIEIDGQQITNSLFKCLQLLLHQSTAFCKFRCFSRRRFTSWHKSHAFRFFQNSHRWFYAIQCSSHDHQTSWREHKAYMGKQSYGSEWFGD